MTATFRDDVLGGLRRPDRRIPCKYLYDEAGSALFDRITGLPEYYLTRTEMALLRRHAGDIAALAGPACRIVEYGAGSSRKVRLLLQAMERPAAYIPVDIARDALEMQAGRLAAEHPGLTVTPVVADFLGSFTLPPAARAGGRTLGFFPGSTIGNLVPAEARDFLARTARVIGGDGVMVIGVDLRKPAAMLEPAYDDAAGVTAAFTLNLLARINRELGGDFDLSGFRHSARWDAARGCMRIELVALRRQTVTVAGQSLHFGGGDTIHVEDSFKYGVAEFQDLARAAGYIPLAAWVDDRRLFSLHALRPG